MKLILRWSSTPTIATASSTSSTLPLPSRLSRLPRWSHMCFFTLLRFSFSGRQVFFHRRCLCDGISEKRAQFNFGRQQSLSGEKKFSMITPTGSICSRFKGVAIVWRKYISNMLVKTFFRHWTSISYWRQRPYSHPTPLPKTKWMDCWTGGQHISRLQQQYNNSCRLHQLITVWHKIYEL